MKWPIHPYGLPMMTIGNGTRVKLLSMLSRRMDIQWTFTAKQVDLGRITLIRIRIEELLLTEIKVEKGKCEYFVVIYVFIS